MDYVGSFDPTSGIRVRVINIGSRLRDGGSNVELVRIVGGDIMGNSINKEIGRRRRKRKIKGSGCLDEQGRQVASQRAPGQRTLGQRNNRCTR